MNKRVFLGWALTFSLAMQTGALAGASQLVRMYLDNGNPGKALTVGTPYLVSAETVTCPKNLVSCTLALSAMDQICGDHIPGGIFFKIILTLNDSPVAGGNMVPYFSFDHACGGGDWADNVSVGPGRYKVKMFTQYDYSDDAATQGPWAVNYTVATP